MPVSIDGPIALPFQQLAKLLASSQTFQTMVGAADFNAALDAIIWPEWYASDSGTANAPVPGANIFQYPGMMLEIEEDSTVQAQLAIDLRKKPDGTLTSWRDKAREAMTTFGLIVKEMGENASDIQGNGQNYVELMDRPTILHPVIRTEQDEEADENDEPFYVVQFMFTIGV